MDREEPSQQFPNHTQSSPVLSPLKGSCQAALASQECPGVGNDSRLEKPAGSAQHLLLSPLSICLGEDSPVFPHVHPSFTAFFPIFPDQHRLLDMEVKQHFPGFVLRPSWSLA